MSYNHRLHFFRATLLSICFILTEVLLAENPNEASYSTLSIEKLKKEVVLTQSKLNKLPLRLIRESGGTLGARIISRINKPDRCWIEVNLGEEKTFDSVVLVPVVFIDENKESSNYAFPTKFQIRTYSSKQDKTGKLLYDSTLNPQHPVSNKTPVIINCPGSSAQRIRVISLEMFKYNSSLYEFAISELLVYDGMRNIALGKLTSSYRSPARRPLWMKNYLTDGYMPYSEPTDPNNQNLKSDNNINACRIYVPQTNERPVHITIDLGHEQPIDEVRLYPAQLGKNFAVFHKAGLGFPKRFKIEVSSDPSFSSSHVTFYNRTKDYPSPGQRLACFAANGISGRYVRISAYKLPSHPQKNGSILSFAEIEVISNGIPISAGKEITSTHNVESKNHPATMLTDGICSSGKIIPMRPWLEGLQLRNQLENKLTTLKSELQQRYLQQSANARKLKWGIAIASAIACLLALTIFFWQRQKRIHEIYRLRETLAADLHDEIGGNFSGIALLSDELTEEADMPSAHIPQLTTIAKISRDSAKNARALVRFLESRSVSGKLLKEMQATAEILLKRHHYNFDVEGYKHVKKLSPKEKWHILLFFKEALNNIAKHALATEVKIKLNLSHKTLNLSITDNGLGLQSPSVKKPTHLAMRAKKLNAQFNISSEAKKGTTITLSKKL